MGEDFEKAKDKLLIGVERKSMIMNESEKKLTAYHEAGHAIVGLHVPERDPVYKVTIIPRSKALGVTLFLPESDRYIYSKQRLECQLGSLFGGRISEELIFGKEKGTTGASNDIERATQIARNMVTKWGLSDKLGPLTYSEGEGEQSMMGSKNNNLSDNTTDIIDREVKKIIDINYKRAENIIKNNMDKMHLMVDALLKYETIDTEQINDIMIGNPARKPKDWH